MQKLTKVEEEIMQALWALERSTVGDIRNWLETHTKEEKPAHSTISTMLRIMSEKGFIAYNVYGRTFEYYPKISKSEYSRQHLGQFVEDYFSGSAAQLVSFLVRDEKLSDVELEELRKMLDAHK